MPANLEWNKKAIFLVLRKADSGIAGDFSPGGAPWYSSTFIIALSQLNIKDSSQSKTPGVLSSDP